VKIDDRVGIAADRFVANRCAGRESHEASHNVENSAQFTKDALSTRPAEIKSGSVSHQQGENLPERVENLKLNVDEVNFNDSASLQREETSSTIGRKLKERPEQLATDVRTGEGDADLKNVSSGGIADGMLELELKVTNSGEPAESKGEGETPSWSPKSLDEMNKNRHRFRGHGGYQITNQAKSSPSKFNSSSATTQHESSPIMHMVEKNEEEKKLIPVNPKFASQDVRLDPELSEKPFTSTVGGDHRCSEQPRRRNHHRQQVKSTNNDKDESNQAAGGEAKKSKTFIPRRSIVCYVCGEEGHRKVDCPHRKTKSNGGNQQE